MQLPIPKFQTISLTKAYSEDDFKLYIAALEWGIDDPIIIKDKNDLRSELNWKELVSPYHHQVRNLITFCRRLPVTLLADDVGLGKTISAGLIASELMARGYVTKIFIVCPKILMPQWKEELKYKFGIESKLAIGQDLLEAKPPNDRGAVITTYHSARLYLDKIAKSGFQMLILDEAHKLRNLYGTPDRPQVSQSFYDALSERLFKFVLMLTATPIQNRLWDIYSLVDLLTIARGHKNPFGSEGMFARDFIADSRKEARQLKIEKKDEFRSIVYDYMSRTRRNDAKLNFPDREVLLHRVTPTKGEIELIETIREPIQVLNPLMQISILQALVSSPHALAAQLENSARKGTISEDLAKSVRSIVNRMPTSAKLEGLNALIRKLKAENEKYWRMVIFTERRETQTTIENYFGLNGISCGLINGDTGPKNQDTIAKFKNNPPEIHVIISTRAGSEGVNLQAANVLVNYDLPWNPMIVEQRIGRIQRLASEHAKVCIFNIVLQNTFEEYIVGRLMEKLQMATNAIGDIDALLEAAGMDEDSNKGFEEKIRELVVWSLAGKDVLKEIILAEESIANAKSELEIEERNINQMLGGSNNGLDFGPRSPDLPVLERSMSERDFTFNSLAFLEADIKALSDDRFSITLDGNDEIIEFSRFESNEFDASLCKSGSPFFEKLISKIAKNAKYKIDDIDKDISNEIKNLGINWTKEFDGHYATSEIKDFKYCFFGNATLHIRVINSQDKYERLIKINLNSHGNFLKAKNITETLRRNLEDFSLIGLPVDFLMRKSLEDKGVSEFCRFYIERYEQEVKSAGGDLSKMKKIEDDFIPKIEILLVGLDGIIFRNANVVVKYLIEEREYETTLLIEPSTKSILEKPVIESCELTLKNVPETCMKSCEISGKKVLNHYLSSSEHSGRLALLDYMTNCSYSRKRVLKDEVDKSDVTGNLVLKDLLRKSPLSGKKAEPNLFAKCEFTSANLLRQELSISQVSSKKYRSDEELKSAISGRVGHKSEFIYCTQTSKSIIDTEAVKCEVTHQLVCPGILEKCEVTGMNVLPSELSKSAISGKKALKKYFVKSSISNELILENEAVKSIYGNYCLTSECKLCIWNDKKYHPEDLQTCSITNLQYYFNYLSSDNKKYFKILYTLLEGSNKKIDEYNKWELIKEELVKVQNSKSIKIINAELSHNSKHLAVCFSISAWAGLKTRYGGLIYSLDKNCIVSAISFGKRSENKWLVEK